MTERAYRPAFASPATYSAAFSAPMAPCTATTSFRGSSTSFAIGQGAFIRLMLRSSILSAVMMLRHVGDGVAADRIAAAIVARLARG